MRSLSLRFIPFAVFVSLVTGCSSIVRKPEINGVRTVAIVSLYADQMIPWTGGTGRVDYFDLDTKRRVASQAYESFSNEFRRLKWEVLPMEQVTSSAYYKKEFGPQQAGKDSNILAKAVNALGEFKNEGYFTAQGLFPIEFPKPDKSNRSLASLDLASFKIETKKDFDDQMADLARDLHVDAVVMVNLDYCYTGATAILGNGTAKFLAGTTIRAYNPEKKLVVNMPDPKKRCENKNLGESEKTVAMVKGSILLAQALAKDAIVAALSEATQQSARLAVDQINKAMLD